MTESVQESLDALRATLELLPSDPGTAVSVAGPRTYAQAVDGCPFANVLPRLLEPSRVEELAARGAEQAPWHQGPFPVAENLVLGADMGDAARWRLIGPHLDARLAQLRVLVVNCGAGYDAFAFAARGAEYVMACEPTATLRQAELLESVYKSGVDFRPASWEALDTTCDGTFDIVYCHGLLHRTLEPMTLLRALRRVTASEGTLLIDSLVLDDPERSELLRFVPDQHAGDATCWFVPGRLAFRWMIETAGFAVEAELGEIEGPRDRFPVVHHHLRASAE